MTCSAVNVDTIERLIAEFHICQVATFASALAYTRVSWTRIQPADEKCSEEEDIARHSDRSRAFGEASRIAICYR